MKFLFKYKDKIVSMGLLPIIGTLIGLHFLPDSQMLGIGALVSLVLLVYGIIRLRQLNFFLLMGTIGIGMCFFVRLASDYLLIPYGSITPILELMLFVCAFIHITVPEVYLSLHRRLKLNECHSFTLEAKIIVVLSGIHLIIWAVSYKHFQDLSSTGTFIMMYGIPISIYIICLLINIVGIRLALQESIGNHLIRIALISGGKIYLTPQKQKEESGEALWDLSIENIYRGPTEFIGQYMQKLTRQQPVIHAAHEVPRLILKHTSHLECAHLEDVLLYILPIAPQMAEELLEGRWFEFEEVSASPQKFAPMLLSEIKHLEVVAGMWKKFGY